TTSGCSPKYSRASYRHRRRTSKEATVARHLWSLAASCSQAGKGGTTTGDTQRKRSTSRNTTTHEGNHDAPPDADPAHPRCTAADPGSRPAGTHGGDSGGVFRAVIWSGRRTAGEGECLSPG